MAAHSDGDPIRYYFVLLLDILGQKEQLGRWENLSADGVVTEDTRGGIQRSLGPVRDVRREFAAILEKWHKCDQQWVVQLSAGLNPPPGSDLDRCKAISVPEIKLRGFSDLLIAYAPATTGSADDWNIVGLLRILELLNILIPQCLACGIALRGGVCIGTGVEYDRNCFYGPAIAVAHDLESRVADYPRVVVSTNLRDFIRCNLAEGNGPIDGFIRNGFERCQGLIADEQDGQTVVDYLGAGSLGSLPATDNFVRQHRKTIADAAKFVTAERERFADAAAAVPSQDQDMARLAEKYLRLENYFRSRRANWENSNPPTGE